MEGLVAQRCTKCGHRMYPRHSRCPSCRNGEFVDEKLVEGKVVTYTKLMATRPGFTKPLVLAIVDFGGLRVLGQLNDAEPKSGLTVKPENGKLSDGAGPTSTGIVFTRS